MHDVRFQVAGTSSAVEPTTPGPISEVESVCDDATKTIHHSRDGSEEFAADLPLLVQETLQHLQNEAELDYPCPEALDRFDKFELDSMTVPVRTSCFD